MKNAVGPDIHFPICRPLKIVSFLEGISCLLEIKEASDGIYFDFWKDFFFKYLVLENELSFHL